MPEVYASNEVTAELLDPIDGSVITSVSIPYRRDLTLSERPVYAQRGYHRSNTLSAAHLRSLGSVSIRKDADSLALAAEIKRWQKGVVFYALSSDLKGKRYCHPHLRVTFTNADGSTEVVTAYNVKLSDRSLSAPDGGIVGDSISLDVLGGFEPKDGGYEPVRALDFARTGTATYLTPSGTLATAGDGVARIGVPWAARRNLFYGSNDFSGWIAVATRTYQETVGPDGSTITAARLSGNGLYLYTGLGGVFGKRAISVYVKAVSTATQARMRLDVPGVGVVDSDTQAISSQTWTRLDVSYDAAGTSRDLFPNIDVIDGDILVAWGQYEIGLTPSTYRPTINGWPDLTPAVAGAGLVLEGPGRNIIVNPTFAADTNADGVADDWGIGLGFAENVAAHAGSLIASPSGLPGSHAQKLSMTRNANAGNAYVSLDQGLFDVTPGQAWTLSGRWASLLNSGGDFLEVVCQYFDASSAYLGGMMGTTYAAEVSAGWRDIEITGTVPAGAAKINVRFLYFVGTPSATGEAAFDLVQLENSPFRTSFMDGTRQPDLCGIVPLQNELAHSHDLTQGAVGSGTWNRTAGASVTKAGTANTVTLAATSDAIYQAVTPTSVASTTRTAAVKLRLGTLSGSVRLRLLDQAGTQIASTTINTTDLHATDARTFYVTGTAASGDTGLRVQLIGNSGTGTVIVESLRLVKGYHPGMEVQTGDTPIPAPASPALDPAWSQNGRMRFRVLPPPSSTGKSYALFGEVYGTTPPNLSIWKSSAYAATGIAFERKHNSTTGTGSTAGRGSLQTASAALFDGAPHDVELEWTNELNEQTGVREMWQRIWVDGTLVASQDVAALYGATAWADIDPSRLVSDGNVFSVLGDLITEYPTPRSGYRPV